MTRPTAAIVLSETPPHDSKETLTLPGFGTGKTPSLQLLLSHHSASQEAGVFSAASPGLPGFEGVWGFLFFI